MSEDETFNKLRRIPFEQTFLMQLIDEFYEHKKPEFNHLDRMNKFWKDEGGWDFSAFKEEYNRRFGEQ